MALIFVVTVCAYDPLTLVRRPRVRLERSFASPRCSSRRGGEVVGGGGGVGCGLDMRAATVVAGNALAPARARGSFSSVHRYPRRQGETNSRQHAERCAPPGTRVRRRRRRISRLKPRARAFAEMYKRDGIFGGHAILLSKDEATMRAAKEAVRAFPGGLQVGGGGEPDERLGVARCGSFARDRDELCI